MIPSTAVHCEPELQRECDIISCRFCFVSRRRVETEDGKKRKSMTKRMKKEKRKLKEQEN